MFQIEFYQTKDGRKPVEEFLDSLDPKMTAKMVARIIITNGFTKKSKKTPLSEISLAKKRRDDWIKRNEMNL